MFLAFFKLNGLTFYTFLNYRVTVKEFFFGNLNFFRTIDLIVYLLSLDAFNETNGLAKKKIQV